MDKKYVDLYQRVQEFSFDHPGAMLPFSKKLARENGWTTQYTQRVIDEYKKFMVLAVAAKHPITPPEHVDQAWHLHLTYTHAYWNKFCAEILERPIHHCPTLGGCREYNKFYCWYSETLITYGQVFGHQPPSDIWPSPAIRLNAVKGMVRINRRDYWLIKKPSLQLLKTAFSLPKSVETNSNPEVSLPRRSAVLLLSLTTLLILYLTFPLVAGYGASSVKSVSSQPYFSQLPSTILSLGIDWFWRDWRVQALCAMSVLFFLVGIYQFAYVQKNHRKPVFEAPSGYTKFKANYNMSDARLIAAARCAERAFGGSLVILLSSLILLLPSGLHFFIVVICFSCLTTLLEAHDMGKTAQFLSARGRFYQLKNRSGSIRPLYCKVCESPLRELGKEVPLENLRIGKAKIVAAKVNKVELQAWHCAQCYSDTNRDSVHWYELGSGLRYDTANCPICQERTMRITRATLIDATFESSGQSVKISTCACCGRKDEEVYTIPPHEPSEPSDIDSGCGVCGI
ncbi:glycine-rich domain-containing protein [Nodosilinea sp. PGN35]|uniref:glycine-rich domain-containing protein n=1 Tax=Nodosilinea sp. PGN35 TaxID=3020489 RepID=UPI0023B33558|nr:hypothetical protein [Nodosilinea sp. TSF1-S3]MDF0366081.1 hypothetical protein [Nodosilinea sp. TSF1-S3]